jgi:hypothetical protein
VVAVDRQEELGRWYLRLRGDEKEFVTVWLTVRQRTLHHETQVMPAPETNIAETFEYLLRRNADLHQMRFALGAEDAVYLVGEVPVTLVNEEELDRIVGSSLAYVDASFPTAMTIGFAGPTVVAHTDRLFCVTWCDTRHGEAVLHRPLCRCPGDHDEGAGDEGACGRDVTTR